VAKHTKIHTSKVSSCTVPYSTSSYLCRHFTPSLHRHASSHHSCGVPSSRPSPPIPCLPSMVIPLPVASSFQDDQAQRVRGRDRTHNSPALLSAVYATPVIALEPQHPPVPLTSPGTHAAKRTKIHPSPFKFASSLHRSLAHSSPPLSVSRAAPQLVLYCTLERSVTAPAKLDACMASLAAASHLAELVTSPTLPTYPFVHGPSFSLTLRHALRSMRASRRSLHCF